MKPNVTRRNHILSPRIAATAPAGDTTKDRTRPTPKPPETRPLLTLPRKKPAPHNRPK